MKNLFVVVLGVVILGLLSCSSRMNYEKKIKEQITNFYTTQDVNEYKPLGFSAFDTIEVTKELDGSSREVIGIVLHTYQGIGENGDTTQFEDTFDVTIYKDMVVAIPRGY